MNEQREDGVMFAVAGATRWGKSFWVKHQVKDAARILVRDPRGEYISEGYTKVKTIRELAGLLREIGTGEARLAFWGSDVDFPDFCVLAYHWGQLWPSVFIVEEVASVTSSGKAAKEWGDLIRMGLYYGNHIYAPVQRPQEADKTLWHNASMIHTHGFVHPDMHSYMASVLGVPVEQVASLEKYEFLERWQGEPEVKRGRIEDGEIIYF